MNSNVAADREVRRYRINPVEMIILATIGGVFLNSIYHLFYDPSGFQPAALKTMAANPVSEGRSPASVTGAFQNAEINCSSNPERATSASKIRLLGPLCNGTETVDGTAAATPDPLIRTVVTNETNKFSATVFTDAASSKFTTDYIPLNPGKNQVKVEFAYKSGKTVTQDLAFSKY
ncbi:MAG: hypothetical protein ACJ763_12300 [Bdellovibrionia bacterium]